MRTGRSAHPVRVGECARRPKPVWWRYAIAAAPLFAVTVAVADVTEPIKPIPAYRVVDRAKAELGERLFHDTRLSKDDTVSCATCHDLKRGGDDGRRVSEGVGGALGEVNAPTVFNVAYNFKQFWDGRAETLEDQIDGPIQSAVEMGSLWPDVIATLYRDETYPAQFTAIYADGITRDNVKDTIAEFMRSLTTPGSRFDAWLGGNSEALDALEVRGYDLFKSYGCASCHQGANVGGNMFQTFGVLNDYFTRRGRITDADRGRFNVTGNEADMHAFKVPSLRMAAQTAPYLHDGRAETLRDAIDIMFEFQLGREAPDADKEAIEAFIRTLAGNWERPRTVERPRLAQSPRSGRAQTTQSPRSARGPATQSPRSARPQAVEYPDTAASVPQEAPPARSGPTRGGR